MSGNRLFKLKWKKKDLNRKTPFPYSFYHKEDNSEMFRGPDGFPYLIPSLKDQSSYARRYRDQVRKAEIELIDNVHLKMFEFRKNAKTRHEIKSSDQGRNSLPYWLFATRTKLMRGLPTQLQQTAKDIEPGDVDALNDIVSVAVREYLLPKSRFRESFDDRSNKHFNGFLKSIAFGLLHNVNSIASTRSICFNQDVETFGLFGKDDKMYQINDSATVAQFRSRSLLEPFEELNSSLCHYCQNEIPDLPHNLDYYQVMVWENPKLRMPLRRLKWVKKRLPVITPVPDAHIFSGVKPGSEFPFIHTQFLMLPRSEVFWRELSSFYHQEVMDCRVLLNMFAATSSTSWYLKFTPYQDITFPISLSSIAYDGCQNMAFYNFQLNTVATGKMLLTESNPVESNSRANLLWSTKLTPLFSYSESFDSIELNPDVVRLLSAMVVRETKQHTVVLPASSWDEKIPAGMPLVRIERDVDPGKIWMKPKKIEKWPAGWHNPQYVWNPQYMKKLEKEGEKDDRPYYESKDGHSEFVREFHSRRSLLD